MTFKVQTSKKSVQATLNRNVQKPTVYARHSQFIRIINHIERSILTGRIAPGEKLNEISLARSLSASRTPVREAIRVLASQGLLVSRVGRGASVPKFSVERITELIDVRSHLECLALELAIPKINQQEIRNLEKILQQMDLACIEKNWKNYENNDEDFHSTILKASKNETLISVIERLSKKIRMARSTILSIPGELENAQQFHRLLFDQIVSKNINASVILRKKVLEEDKNKLLKLFKVKKKVEFINSKIVDGRL